MASSGVVMLRPDGTRTLRPDGTLILGDDGDPCCCGGGGGDCDPCPAGLPDAYLLTGIYDGQPFHTTISREGSACEWQGVMVLDDGGETIGTATLYRVNADMTCGYRVDLAGDVSPTVSPADDPVGPYPDLDGAHSWANVTVS